MSSNITAATAQVITALPFSVVGLDTSGNAEDFVDDSSGGIGPLRNPAWYKYTGVAGDAVIAITGLSDDYYPDIIVYTGSPGALVQVYQGLTTGYNRVNRTVAGTDYYIAIVDRSGGGGLLDITVIRQPVNAVPAGSIAIPDSRGFIWFLSSVTGAVLRIMLLNNKRSGYLCDVLASGTFASWGSPTAGKLWEVYDRDVNLLAADVVDPDDLGPLPGGRSDGDSTFYLGRSISTTAVEVVEVASNGVPTGQRWTLPQPPQIGGTGYTGNVSLAVSPDRTILYYYGRENATADPTRTAIIARYDLVNSVLLSPLVIVGTFSLATPTVDCNRFFAADVLTLPSGDILASYCWEGDFCIPRPYNTAIRRFQPNGTLVATYPVLSYQTPGFLMLSYLASDPSGTSFWTCVIDPGVQGGQLTFQKFDVASGTVLTSIVIPMGTPTNVGFIPGYTQRFFITRASIIARSSYHIQVI